MRGVVEVQERCSERLEFDFRYMEWTSQFTHGHGNEGYVGSVALACIADFDCECIPCDLLSFVEAQDIDIMGVQPGGTDCDAVFKQARILVHFKFDIERICSERLYSHIVTVSQLFLICYNSV